MTEQPVTVQFEVGHTYSVRSLGDWDCIFSFEVLARTPKFLTIVDANDNKRTPSRVGVRVYEGVEKCSPLGRYSMSPTLSADRMAVPA